GEVLDAVGVEAVEGDVGDVVQAQDEPAVVPGAAAPAGGVIDPTLEDAPVGEAVAGADRSQPDVVDRGGEGLPRAPLADLPGAMAQPGLVGAVRLRGGF